MAENVRLLEAIGVNDAIGEVGQEEVGVRQRTNRRGSDKLSGVRVKRLVDERDVTFDTDLEKDKEDTADGVREYDEDESRHRHVNKYARRKMIYLAKKITPDSLFIRIVEVNLSKLYMFI